MKIYYMKLMKKLTKALKEVVKIANIYRFTQTSHYSLCNPNIL